MGAAAYESTHKRRPAAILHPLICSSRHVFFADLAVPSVGNSCSGCLLGACLNLLSCSSRYDIMSHFADLAVPRVSDLMLGMYFSNLSMQSMLSNLGPNNSVTHASKTCSCNANALAAMVHMPHHPWPSIGTKARFWCLGTFWLAPCIYKGPRAVEDPELGFTNPHPKAITHPWPGRGP